MMGQSSAKYFPWPTPYGTSPANNVVSQAQAAPQAPPTNFLPLNPAAPQTPAQPQQQNPVLNQFGTGGVDRMNPYAIGGLQRGRFFYDT